MRGRARATMALPATPMLEAPELLPLLVIVGGWLGLLIVGMSPRPHVTTSWAATPALLGVVANWTLMATAMMAPLAIPACRFVGLNSLRRRRQRACATFLAAYLAVWAIEVVLVGVGLAGLQGMVSASPYLVGATLLSAAIWQVSPLRRRVLGSCQIGVPLPPTGAAATWAVARFGARSGIRCIASCWALMLVMMAAPFGIGAMLAATTILAADRFVVAIRRRPLVVALGYLILAVPLMGAGPPSLAPTMFSWLCHIPGP